MKILWNAAPALWALFFSQGAVAQGAGAQVYFLPPVGLQSIAATYQSVESNFRFGQTLFGEADIQTRSMTVSYTYNFPLRERFAQVSVQAGYLTILGRGKLDPGALPNLPREVSARQYGFGDPYLSFRLGLIGAPALEIREWLETEKGFQMYLKLGATAPIGDYDSAKVLNTGFNRWAFEVSLPMVLPLDRIPRKTFLEITPTIRTFGDNTEPFGDARVLEQDNLYSVEFQASHLFTPRFYMSLGVQYQKGGRTIADGIPYNNEFNQWFGEIWLGFRANQNVVLAASYGEIFGQADNEAEGNVWRARAVLAFD